MSLLSRLFDPDSGSVSIDGVDLRRLDVDSLRYNISVALQENVLFGMSVRDNIRYVVPDASDVEVLRAAEVACVNEYIAGLPEGLDTMLSDRGGKLSTGQRQRLSIARAVVKDTPILILDETHCRAGCLYRTPGSRSVIQVGRGPRHIPDNPSDLHHCPGGPDYVSRPG